MTPTLPIAFFGSGPVAAASLRLLAEHFTIEVVITKPRPEHHHGSVPVLEAAAELNLPVLTAANRAELSAVVAAQSFASQLAVLIDFGIIVNQDVIDAWPLGIVNSHFSLLPEWRGADPISFALLSGQPTTGVSLMLLVPAMDEGPLLAQAEVAIDHQTIDQLTASLVTVSDSLLSEHLPAYVSGQLSPQAQVGQPTYSRKLTKADGELDFTKSADQLEREIRAFLTWPKSHARLAGHDVIITEAHVISGQGPAGEVYRAGQQLGWYCGQAILVIDQLKPAGKGPMSAAGFIAGYLQ